LHDRRVGERAVHEVFAQCSERGVFIDVCHGSC
jgi:hypothetical protein